MERQRPKPKPVPKPVLAAAGEEEEVGMEVGAHAPPAAAAALATAAQVAPVAAMPPVVISARRQMVQKCKATKVEILQLERKWSLAQAAAAAKAGQPGSKEAAAMGAKQQQQQQQQRRPETAAEQMEAGVFELQARYRRAKRTIRGSAASAVSALVRGFLARRRLARARGRSGGGGSSGGGSGGGSGVDNTAAATAVAVQAAAAVVDAKRVVTLRAKKRELKAQLKAFDVNFKRAHRRVPVKAEKEPIRYLYETYNDVKTVLCLLAASPPAGTPAAASAAANSNNNHNTTTVVKKEDGVSEDGRELRLFSEFCGRQAASSPPPPSGKAAAAAAGPSAAPHAAPQQQQQEKDALEERIRGFMARFAAGAGRKPKFLADLSPAVTRQYVRFKELKMALMEQGSGGGLEHGMGHGASGLAAGRVLKPAVGNSPHAVNYASDGITTV